jgi:hypothetical protein
MQRPRPLNSRPQQAPPDIPTPSPGSRWRWSPSRRALVGGGVLAAVLSLGSVAAGAAATSSTNAPAGAPAGAPPADAAKPAAAGKITALSGNDITITNRDKTTETIVFAASTTFRTRSGTTTSSALKVGDFIAVMGTTNSDGTVTATSVMVGSPPPGRGGPGGPGGHRGGKPPAGQGGPPPGAPASA